MPLFFIVSGYFYKEKKVKELFKREFRTLLIPYLIISIILILYGCIMCIIRHDVQRLLFWTDPFLYAGIKDVGPLWFLLAMFWCRMFYNIFFKILSKVFRNPILLLFITSYIVFIVVSYLHTVSQSINFQCVITGLASMVYYSIGHIWRISKNKIIETNILLVISLIICLISVHFSMGTELRLLNQNPISNLLAAISATFIIYRIAAKIATTNSVSKFLSWFGRLSLVVFFFHTIMFRLLPIDRAIELVFPGSNLQFISLFAIIFHLIIAIIFCVFSERSKYLKQLFNI